MVYQSNKALHPGFTIQRMLDSLGMTQKKLSERTGLSEKHLSQLINGEVLITADTALLLENALDGNASYWMNLDKNYRETRARIEQDERVMNEIHLLSNFPYNDLVKEKQVPDTRIKAERVKGLWKFFGVNSLDYIPNTEAVAYRRRDGAGVKSEALASWLRLGEIRAMELDSKIGFSYYTDSALKESLSDIRSMTATHERVFFEKLQEKLANAGVGLVAVSHFKNTQVHGATRWLGGNPIIQLSIYGKDADKFWFTLFHEIGHILQHGKKQQFLEFTKAEKSNEEQEADIFARRALISDSEYGEFIRNGDYSELAISKFANTQGISKGIIVGRLKRDGLVPYQQFQHLHEKLVMVQD
ncbi:MAG: HigA family addiction module antitoxin [Candidatus Saccharimonas sp.]